jgi:hypothetical protein
VHMMIVFEFPLKKFCRYLVNLLSRKEIKDDFSLNYLTQFDKDSKLLFILSPSLVLRNYLFLSPVALVLLTPSLPAKSIKLNTLCNVVYVPFSFISRLILKIA